MTQPLIAIDPVKFMTALVIAGFAVAAAGAALAAATAAIGRVTARVRTPPRTRADHHRSPAL